MNKNIVWLLVIVGGFSFWAYKIYNTTQAYYVAKTTIENRIEIEQSLGTYKVTYDWWFGVFRALRYGKVQEFEFHISASKGDAVSVVEVVKTQSEWQVSCINVVNGQHLNKRIIQECNGVPIRANNLGSD
tara:strand:- start:1192 stop:1581 length:390 start_codon:yes stop_codon:yes gene_type:complete